MDYTGTLLIASPHLEDPNFRLTVVLLIHQTKSEVLGLVLNRPSNRTVGRFWQEVFDESCSATMPLYLGGPVVGPVMALYAEPVSEGIDFSPQQDEIAMSVALAIDKSTIKTMAESKFEPLRVFLGHAGWSVEQLAGEINEGVWHLLPADEEDLFAEPTELWVRALQRSARASLQRVVGLSELPENPENN